MSDHPSTLARRRYHAAKGLPGHDVTGGPEGRGLPGKNARSIARAGMIAAVYAALTLPMLQHPIGYGPVQVRLSEAVTVVALFTPAAVPGLALGAALANAFMLSQVGMLALLDVVFGSLATLLGAVWTWRLRRRPAIALLGPIVTNAVIVPAYLPIMLGAAGASFYTLPGLGTSVRGPIAVYLFGMVGVGLGQLVAVFGLGWPLQATLRRLGVAEFLSGGGG